MRGRQNARSDRVCLCHPELSRRVLAPPFASRQRVENDRRKTIAKEVRWRINPSFLRMTNARSMTSADKHYQETAWAFEKVECAVQFFQLSFNVIETPCCVRPLLFVNEMPAVLTGFVAL